MANVPIPKRYDARGRKYHEVLIDIILLFGLTELKAQIAWKQNVRRSLIRKIFLVGGFAASDYLFRRVKESLESHDLQVFRPDAQM